MKTALLFSGGKDSGLSALLLEPFFDEIDFGSPSPLVHDEAWKVAERAAQELGHPHRRVAFEEGVLDRALEILISTGYPTMPLTMFTP